MSVSLKPTSKEISSKHFATQSNQLHTGINLLRKEGLSANQMLVLLWVGGHSGCNKKSVTEGCEFIRKDYGYTMVDHLSTLGYLTVNKLSHRSTKVYLTPKGNSLVESCLSILYR